MRLILTISALTIATFQLAAQTTAAPDWKQMEFLLGNWKGVAGEHDSALGAGQGSFSLEAQLDKRIVVRRNEATYSSGARHDDLMVIYFDNGESRPRAIYFDSEGHVIRYQTDFPAANRVVFESDRTAPGPKYRLTYWKEAGFLKGTFEVAPPGAEYKTYLSWTSVKTGQ